MEHNVETFISLSSPQNGQFGEPTDIQKSLGSSFGDKCSLWKYFYKFTGQLLSVANYWRDPYHLDEYAKYSDYLAHLNGESVKNSTVDPQWKINFTKVNQLITIGGPDDGVIEPWQSAHFSNYVEGNDKVVKPYDQFDFYKNDVFGLKTMDDAGRWQRIVKKGVEHSQWIRNTEIIMELIVPYLV